MALKTVTRSIIVNSATRGHTLSHRVAHKSGFRARSAIVRARSAERERARASESMPGPTTPDQKTKRATLRKSSYPRRGTPDFK